MMVWNFKHMSGVGHFVETGKLMVNSGKVSGKECKWNFKREREREQEKSI